LTLDLDQHVTDGRKRGAADLIGEHLFGAGTL